MKFNSNKLNIPSQPLRKNLNWGSKSYFKSSPPEFQANTWVHLLELPSDFSSDEALLLCQISDDEWVTWIPEYGEAVLTTRQFCAC